MSDKSAQGVEPVSFSEKLASSQAFAALFKEGMGLVEETASYLDGPGRQDSKKLERRRGACYATESMRPDHAADAARLLVAVASPVKEGEMSLARPTRKRPRSSCRSATAPMPIRYRCCRNSCAT